MLTRTLQRYRDYEARHSNFKLWSTYHFSSLPESVLQAVIIFCPRSVPGWSFPLKVRSWLANSDIVDLTQVDLGKMIFEEEDENQMRTQGEISNQSLHLFDSEAFAKIRTLVDASQPHIPSYWTFQRQRLAKYSVGPAPRKSYGTAGVDDLHRLGPFPDALQIDLLATMFKKQIAKAQKDFRWHKIILCQ